MRPLRTLVTDERRSEVLPSSFGQGMAADNELLASIESHLEPCARAQASLILAVAALCDQPFQALGFHRMDEIVESALEDRRITNRLFQLREDMLFEQLARFTSGWVITSSPLRTSTSKTKKWSGALAEP